MLPLSLIQNTLKYREFLWFKDALSQDFSEHSGFSEEKGWCLYHAVTLFAPPIQKENLSQIQIQGVGQFSPGAQQWRATHVYLLAYNPKYIHSELIWLMQVVRKILTNNSEFNSLSFSCYNFLLWILWCKR